MFRKFGFVTLLLMVSVISQYATAGVLFQDDFENGVIDARYIIFGVGDWQESGGTIKQAKPHPGDPTYLAINGGFPAGVGAIVKVRVDEWEDHDLSRTGLGFRNDSATGEGYAFLIHQTLNNMEFLNDKRAWKQNDTPPPFGPVEIGKWYWMKGWIDDGGFKGKIWPVGEAEPAAWLLDSALDFGAVRNDSGTVALNGGSSSGAGSGLTVVTFDDFAVCDAPADCASTIFAISTAVESKNKLAVTWGALKRQ
jgi:hypothetical protein